MNISSTAYNFYNNRPGPLEIKQLAEFDAALGTMPDEEKKRRRIMYLRDALQQAAMAQSMLKGFGFLLVLFCLIPIFWPFLAFFWFMRRKSQDLMRAQFENALVYWDIRREELAAPVGRSGSTS